MDPYVVGAAIIDTTILEESLIEPLYNHYKLWREWVKTANIEE
jgi:hypothetical protein